MGPIMNSLLRGRKVGVCEGHAELDFGERRIDKARIAIGPRSVDRGNVVGSRDAIGQPYDRDALLCARNGRRISDTTTPYHQGPQRPGRDAAPSSPPSPIPPNHSVILNFQEGPPCAPLSSV